MKPIILIYALMITVSSSVVAQSNGEMAVTSSSPNTSKLVRQSWIAYGDAKIDEGNAHLDQALKEDPDCGIAYATRFSADRKARTENIRRALELKLSADERLFIEGLKAKTEQKPARHYFQPLIKKYPRDYYLHLLIMYTLYQEEGTIEIGENLIRRNKKFAPAYNLLGYEYMHQNDMAKAESYFNKYLSLQPDLANPYDSKGDFLMRVGKTEEAIKLYEKAFTLGMAESKVKADEAKAKLKYPELSETEKNIIKTMLSASIDSYQQNNVDVLLKDYSQQAVKIWGNQAANVGIANVREIFSERFTYAPYTRFDGSIESIVGIGSIAIAYGQYESSGKNAQSGQETNQAGDFIYLLRKRGNESWKILADHFYGEEEKESNPLSDEDKKNIQTLLSNWDHAHAFGGPFTEEHLPTYAALHSPQIIEIYPNQVTNIGTGNLLARLQHAIGINFEKSALNPIAIEGRGRRAVAWGIASQIVYPRGSDKSISRQYPWAMILSKENDNMWRVLVVHWAP